MKTQQLFIWKVSTIVKYKGVWPPFCLALFSGCCYSVATQTETESSASMFSFTSSFIWLARKVGIIAAATIFFMMALTCADVFLRLFRMPIPGTYEIVSFMGAVAVSFAVARTSAEKGHVAVSLVVQLLPKRAQAVIESIIASFGIILFAFIAWQSVIYALGCQRSGEVSLTLQMPFYPIIYGVAFGAVIECLVLVVDLVNAVLELRQG
jgi:TRAP-type C4-dicarboxylate transport system permease small subunit